MIHRMLKNFIILPVLCASLLAASCSYKPKPIMDRLRPPELPDGYSADAKQGFADGCETGYDVFGPVFAKAFYNFKRDPTKIGNKDYEGQWMTGYNYCRMSYRTSINNDESDWGNFFTLK